MKKIIIASLAFVAALTAAFLAKWNMDFLMGIVFAIGTFILLTYLIGRKMAKLKMDEITRLQQKIKNDEDVYYISDEQ